MLQFLHPIWLLAIGAIIIPLAIHLWNVKKGKTLKIGSIQLLGVSSKQNSRSLRLQDLWLLLLRCLLLVVLAILLAAPLLVRKAPAEKIKGWILVDKQHLEEIYKAFKPDIDSLLKLGYQSRYFNPGFGEFDLTDTAQADNDIPGDSISPISYWSLAKALDEKLPANASAYIFTDNRLERFTGSRPRVRSAVIWQTYNRPDSVFNQIEQAYLTQRDSLRIILSRASPAGTSISSENTSINNLNPAYQLSRPNGTSVRFSSTADLTNMTDSSFLAIDTSRLRIALFTDKYPADMAYVKAALDALQTYSQRRMTIATYRDRNKVPASSDWLFWLSDAPVSGQVGNTAKNVFTYHDGKTISENNSFFRAKDNKLFDYSTTGLYKRKAATQRNQNTDVLWEDTRGNPVLTRVAKEESSEFKFYSRFDPEWNDLVWNPRFPEALLELIFKESKTNGNETSNDRRTLPLSQIVPVQKSEPSPVTGNIRMSENKLDKPLWALFVLVFALERWIAHNKRSTNTND